MNEKSTNFQQEEDTQFAEEKKAKKFHFWIFFFAYLILFALFWLDSIREFGFFYIMGVGCFVSFFLAWASSLFILLYKLK